VLGQAAVVANLLFHRQEKRETLMQAQHPSIEERRDDQSARRLLSLAVGLHIMSSL
jgi:hypothetical protein